jgi:hypothetical protein
LMNARMSSARSSNFVPRRAGREFSFLKVYPVGRLLY